MDKKKLFKKIFALTLVFTMLIPVCSVTTTQTYAASSSEGVSNNRNYEWYMDQGSTGYYSDINCGPTSAAMVAKWVNGNSTDTGESLRKIEPNNGQWWNTKIIESYFRSRNINYSARIYSEYTLLNTIKNGGIALVCLNMGKISKNPNPTSSKIGKFYDGNSGHFIVVKGYKYIQDELYFEVYDPGSMGLRYSNGQYLGKDRLYKASELGDAINSWWNTIYTVR